MKTPDFRKIDFEIPVCWTPEQAFAVFELVDDLREKILGYYRLQIQELMPAQHGFDDEKIEIPEEDLPF
jgi:hypothetical protein